ncbi:MAG: T9SS type A sorting domain-containing protein [Bacteroidota bacterium]
MKKLLLYFFIVMSGAMTATTIKNRDVGPTAVALTTIDAVCGTANGSITFGTVTGGVAPFTYSIDGGATYSTTTQYYGLAAGTYTIAVKDSNGDVYNTSATIVDIPGPTTITTTIVNEVCGASNGSITITGVTGGTAPYQYSFGGFSGYSVVTTYTNLPAGTYGLDVKDANGCIYATSVTIIDTPGPTDIVVISSDSHCGASDGSITLGAVTGGTVPYSYDFNNSGFNVTTVYTGLAAGSYTLEVKDMNGCIYHTTVNISNIPGPTAIATTSVDETCGAANGSVTFGAVTGGTAPYQYNFNNLGFSGATSYTNLIAGSYTLDVKDANGCTYSTAVTIINNSSLTSVATTVTNAASCGIADGSITIDSVTGGVAPYTHSFDGTAFTTQTTYTGLSIGTYALITKDANGCIYTTSITITSSNNITALATTVSNENCSASNGSITISGVTGGVAPYTYNFNNIGFSPNTTYSGLSAGTYNIIVKDVNGCDYYTTIIVSSVNSITAVAITTTNSNCGAGDGSISIGAVTGGSPNYTYSLNGSPFTTTNTYNSLLAGSYTVKVKDANGCVFTTNATITTSKPTAIVTTISGTSITLGAVTGGVAPYTYSVNNSAYSSVTVYNGLVPDAYVTIKVKDANGCVYTKTITIPNPLKITLIGVYVDSNTDGLINAGDAVDYQITVKNNGNVPITNVGVVDYSGATVLTGSPIPSLAAGASNSTNFTGHYIITQTNINNGYTSRVLYATGNYDGVNITKSGGTNTPLATPDRIKMIAFIDTNNNGIKDSGEQKYTQGYFHYELNNNGIVREMSSSNGEYTIYETNPANSYDLSYTSYNSNYTLTVSSYSNITVPAGSGITTYNFALTVVVPFTNLGVILNTGTNPPRPGFTYDNSIYYYNSGTQVIASGTVTFVNDNRVTITNISVGGTTPTANGFTYDFINLLPGEGRTIGITMQVPTIPTIQLGNQLTNSVSVIPPAGDTSYSDNNFTRIETIVGSYDPNDKTESHGPQIVHSTFASTDYLYYTIQFENTGTADAVTIKVNDLLDAKLDETSVKMIDGSHNYTLERIGNDLTWYFDNINLPPSVADTSIGKGYINFQVKPRPGYAIGDIINNTAYIYFDFNPAIVTNTFATEFVTTLGVQGFVNSQFSAYPNPTTGIITIELKNSTGSIDTITVTDVLGKTVLSNTVNTANTIVDLSNLTKGLYFVRIQAEGLVKTLKVVKE